jgi:hypothetical protein
MVVPFPNGRNHFWFLAGWVMVEILYIYIQYIPPTNGNEGRGGLRLILCFDILSLLLTISRFGMVEKGT